MCISKQRPNLATSLATRLRQIHGPSKKVVILLVKMPSGVLVTCKCVSEEVYIILSGLEITSYDLEFVGFYYIIGCE